MAVCSIAKHAPAVCDQLFQEALAIMLRMTVQTDSTHLGCVFTLEEDSTIAELPKAPEMCHG